MNLKYLSKKVEIVVQYIKQINITMSGIISDSYYDIISHHHQNGSTMPTLTHAVTFFFFFFFDK